MQEAFEVGIAGKAKLLDRSQQECPVGLELLGCSTDGKQDKLPRVLKSGRTISCLRGVKDAMRRATSLVLRAASPPPFSPETIRLRMTTLDADVKFIAIVEFTDDNI